jgi:hypothetical protein
MSTPRRRIFLSLAELDFTTDESPMLRSPKDSFFGLTNLSRSSCLQYSMGWTRRWREPDEDDDAITTGVGGDIDVEIRLPVVNGPNVAGLINDHARLTHHWDEAWLSAWTVQRISIMQKHRATC